MIINKLPASAISNASGYALGKINDLRAHPQLQTILLTWHDPENVLDSASGTLAAWSKTTIVRSLTANPLSEKEGTIVCTNTQRDYYASVGFVDTNVTVHQNYYYTAFAHTDTGIISRGNSFMTNTEIRIYGVSIDLANFDPAAAVTYIDDAVGMTPGPAGGGYNEWDSQPIFKDIRPCILGTARADTLGGVLGYLNKDNYTQYENGSSAPIGSMHLNTMVEFPKIGYQIITNGNILTVRITNNPNNPDFKYYAFSRDTEGDREKLYIGAYKNIFSNFLISNSGYSPAVNQALHTSRSETRNNGAGYDLIHFHAITLLQCLFLIRFKSTHSQAALGNGYVNGTTPQLTGATNDKGMYYGNPNSSTDRVKCFGIEDLWGNVAEWLDGLYCNQNYEILTAFKDFNNTGAGYKNNGVGATQDLAGYMRWVQGTSETGFIIKQTQNGNGTPQYGSSTTYFCDYVALLASRVSIFGGRLDAGFGAGVFYLGVTANVSASSIIGSRLMFL